MDPGQSEIQIRVMCSKGTYIRALARDIGTKLGTCATMSSLVRTGVGNLSLDQSIDVEALRYMPPDEIERRILPMDLLLESFPIVELGEWESKLFSNGVKLRGDQWESGDEERSPEEQTPKDMINKDFPLELPKKYDNLYRVYDKEKVFMGMGISLPGGEFKADKILR